MDAIREPLDPREDPLRAQAIKRLKAKNDFFRFLWVWLGVSLIVNAVWFLAGASNNYWPVWPMFGMGIAAFFSGLKAFGPVDKGLSEARIEAEMTRLSSK